MKKFIELTATISMRCMAAQTGMFEDRVEGLGKMYYNDTWIFGK